MLARQLKRVLDAAEQLGYHPNLSARTLKQIKPVVSVSLFMVLVDNIFRPT